jgi:hypothetical protein
MGTEALIRHKSPVKKTQVIHKSAKALVLLIELTRPQSAL